MSRYFQKTIHYTGIYARLNKDRIQKVTVSFWRSSVKYTASYLTLSHLFHTIGRLSETAKKNFLTLNALIQAALIINRSASRNVLRKIHNQIYLFSFMNSLSLDISHLFAWNVCGLSLSILRCDLCLTNRFYLVILKELTVSISISGRLGRETTDISGQERANFVSTLSF